jgi:hypothetical protein
MNKVEDAETLRKCAHEPCECVVSSPEDYCCAYCSEADNVEETDVECHCGHDVCLGD